jgi:hypothetical protein
MTHSNSVHRTPSMARSLATLFGVAGLVAVLVSACSVTLWPRAHRLFNWTGAHQAKAQSEAIEWVARDPTLTGAEIECTKHDSDGDGFITCTVFAPTDQITLECPGRRLFGFTENHGCKPTDRLTGRLHR